MVIWLLIRKKPKRRNKRLKKYIKFMKMSNKNSSIKKKKVAKSIKKKKQVGRSITRREETSSTKIAITRVMRMRN